MMRWTAIIPLKLSEDRKSRLAPLLSREDRRQLGDQMAHHVIAELRSVAAIDDIIMLSPRPLPDWPVRHVADQGRGLNAELDEVALAIPNRLLVIHGDLPLASSEDIKTLINAAEANGSAIAPDRHEQGTNALALSHMPPGFSFAFGANSFALHSERLSETLAIVRREGLTCDVDTPDDLAYVKTLSY
jgi:2-phospho-L-lactate guanylyltransferase